MTMSTLRTVHRAPEKPHGKGLLRKSLHSVEAVKVGCVSIRTKRRKQSGTGETPKVGPLVSLQANDGTSSVRSPFPTTW